MKMFKKALAVVLAIVFVLSLAACHPKDEVAVSVGDYTVTSAMYSYYLTMADSEAKSLIANSDDYNTEAADFDLYKQTIDGKSYEEYVKAKALEGCLRYIALEKLCDEAKVVISDEDKEGWESTAEYYWTYAYGAILIENGVSFETYKKIFINDALYGEYFEYLYGAEGTKPVDDESIKEALSENYTAVYMITHSYSDVEERDVDEISESLDKYVQALKDGKSFAEVEEEYNKDNETEDDSSTTTSSDDSSTDSSEDSSAASSDDDSSTTTSSTESSESEEEEEKEPVDSKIQILTKYEDTYTGEATLFEKYEEVEKLKADEVALIHDEDAKAYYIVVKKDITADEYYLEALTDEILYLLKSDEFDTMLNDTAAKLEYEVSNYAVNQFKVKKIYDGSDLYQ